MKKITDLRESLFETIELIKKGQLKAADGRAIAELGQVMVNSAKAEVDFMNTVGASKGTGFLVDEAENMPEQKQLQRPAAPLSTQEQVFAKYGV